ncbi:hypothetical protein ACF06X_34270 [Streptomyces sp. NPDC015346]|uniref:hypothetical protein n=1 Tax=Streptomyces sp. NPDC015346 TaxID=3364954 RepID=UPI003700D5C6
MSGTAAPVAALIPSPRASVDGDSVSVLPALYVPEARQWLSTSTGRVALDGYSWMQVVHWVAGSGLYEPRRYHSNVLSGRRRAGLVANSRGGAGQRSRCGVQN